MLWRIRNSIENFVYNRFYAQHVDIADSSPVVTFTFDDFPESAFFNGGRLLEKYGARGTFYLAPGLYEQITRVGKIISRTDINKCIEVGHEIGHHTYSHLDCSTAKRNEIIADIEKANIDLGVLKTENFSFPFGRSNIKSKKILRNYFKSCRGIQSGINRGIIDTLNLKSNAIYLKNNNLDSLKQLIIDVKKNGGWLIFYTHDVTQTPGSYGCTEENLECLINAVIESDINIATVEEVLAKLL